MKHSQSLSETLSTKEFQLPLKGFHVEVPSGKDGWKTLVEGMGGQRVRIHMQKIKK